MSDLVGLTSTPLAWCIGGAAATSIGTTVWLSPRLARQGIGQVAARLGLIVVSQLLVSAAVLLAINDSLYFFTSWNSLLGRGLSVQASVPPSTAGAMAISHPIVITGSSIGTTFRGGSALPVGYVGGGSSEPEAADAEIGRAHV